MWFFDRFRKNNKDTAAPSSESASPEPPCPEPSTPNPGERDVYAKYMTGQLIALYKQTHQPEYQIEYRTRLQKIGFSEAEATALFFLELMMIKHFSVNALAADDYLTSACFDLQTVRFPESNEYYISHQTFTVSEIVKIWDEAEWHYFHSHEKELPAAVWQEIYAISRYGGGELYLGYIRMIAEKANLPEDKIHCYAGAEQGLLYKYKWYPGNNEPHPYL